MNHLVTLTLVAAVSLPTLTVGGPATSPTTEAALNGWEQTALYEPCMNGEVSAGGLYPSQAAENKSRATMGYLAGNDS